MKNLSAEKRKQKGTLREKWTARKIIAFILFLTLILSVIYALTRFILAPSELAAGEPFKKLKIISNAAQKAHCRMTVSVIKRRSKQFAAPVDDLVKISTYLRSYRADKFAVNSYINDLAV